MTLRDQLFKIALDDELAARSPSTVILGDAEWNVIMQDAAVAMDYAERGHIFGLRIRRQQQLPTDD